MDRPAWLLLSSRLPREPSRLRLGVWRRLRRIGAVLLHDSVWVLPAGDETREALEWLAQEIEEQGGTALVWEATALSADQDRRVVDHFRREADERYAEIAAAAREIRDAVVGNRRGGTRRRVPRPGAVSHALRRLDGLKRALRLERRRDWFRAPGAAAAAAALQEIGAELERAAGAEQGGGRRAVGD
jgi:hypothetical protein